MFNDLEGDRSNTGRWLAFQVTLQTGNIFGKKFRKIHFCYTCQPRDKKDLILALIAAY